MEHCSGYEFITRYNPDNTEFRRVGFDRRETDIRAAVQRMVVNHDSARGEASAHLIEFAAGRTRTLATLLRQPVEVDRSEYAIGAEAAKIKLATLIAADSRLSHHVLWSTPTSTLYENPELALRVALELKSRDATAHEFIYLYNLHKCTRLDQVLHLLDYRRSSELERRMWAVPRTGQPEVKLDLTPAEKLAIMTPVEWHLPLMGNSRRYELRELGAMGDLIDQLKGEILKGIDTNTAALRYWAEIEATLGAEPTVWLRFMQELVRREASFGEFFFASVFANVKHLGAVLHYMDYLRIKPN